MGTVGVYTESPSVVLRETLHVKPRSAARSTETPLFRYVSPEPMPAPPWYVMVADEMT